MLKALVTGGAGFIGYHLARTLAERDYVVDILDNHAGVGHDGALEELLARPNVRLLEADLRSRDVAAGLDTDYDRLFHMAAIMEVTEGPYDVLTANVAMLETALAIARRQRALGRILYASVGEVGALTAQALGRSPSDGAPALGDLTAPDASYLLSKLYGEAMCRSSGVPYTIVRLPTVYGPRMGRSHRLAQLLEEAHRRGIDEPMSLEGAEPGSPLCYVDDAVEYLVRMSMLPGCSNQTYTVDPPPPMPEAQHTIGPIVLPERPLPGPPALRKAIEATGYRPRIDLNAGVRKTYDWYRGHVSEGASVRAQ